MAFLRDEGAEFGLGDTPHRFFFATEDLGLGGDTPDEFRVEFWFDEEIGVIDLGSPVNTQYANCTHCVRVYVDSGEESRGYSFFDGEQYLQSEGTMALGRSGFDGLVSFELIGVTLVETSFDGTTSTPVPGGACITISDGTYSTPPVPPDWTCSPPAYSDSVCDCGCGAFDLACADMTVDACTRCSAEGSCDSLGGPCPGTIDPTDNTRCTQAVTPDVWSGPTEQYADGGL